MLILPMAILATGQTSGEQSAQSSRDEQKIIAVSHQFADEFVLNSATVVKHISATHPKRITAVKDGEANPLKMDQVKVSINGNKAKLTSRLVFSGHRSNGEAYERFNGWNADLIKQGEEWKVTRARMGRIGQ